MHLNSTHTKFQKNLLNYCLLKIHNTETVLVSKFIRGYKIDLGHLHTLWGLGMQSFPLPIATVSWTLIYSEVMIIILLRLILGNIFFFNFYFRKMRKHKRLVPSFFLNYPCSDKLRFPVEMTFWNPPLTLMIFALHKSMQWHPSFTSSSWSIAVSPALGFKMMLQGYCLPIKLSLNSFLALGSICSGCASMQR